MASYPFFSGKKPRIIGHRGAMGEAPENTLASFQKALDDGAAFVELDVRGTKDGEVVIIHDATLGRTTNGRGRVRKRALKDIKKLDAGYWFSAERGKSFPYRGRKIDIPTLEEFLTTFPKARAIVEIKQARPSITRAVIGTVRRLKREEQVLLASESDRILKEARRELKEKGLTIATGFSYGEVADLMSWLAGGRRGRYVPPGQALQIPCAYAGMTLVSQETVRAAHDVGAEMFVWTINETDEMERLLQLGVDGIITDYPARLRELLSAERRKPFQS